MGTYGESKIGLVRKVNEDSFYISHEKNVLAVADGMGGYVLVDLLTDNRLYIH